MRIGELARLTGTTPKAVRHYEARGLLGKITRAGSYRVYGADDLARTQLIRQAQKLGFRLSQLQPIDALHTAQGWGDMVALVDERRRLLAVELRRLKTMDQQLLEARRALLDCAARSAPVSPNTCA